MNLSTMKITLYLCAVCQRQISVYDDYARGKAWGNCSAVHSLLEACWTWVALDGASDKPPIPSEADYIDNDSEQSSSGLAVDAFSSIWHLTNWINNNDPSSISGPIENSFIILDAYVYEQMDFDEVSQINDEFVDNSELVKREIDRQKQQLALVRSLSMVSESIRNFKNEMTTIKLIR